MSEHTNFMELCEILDRENLTENQVALLVADIIVGDISLDYYINLKEKTSGRISTNAQKVIDKANKIKY